MQMYSLIFNFKYEMWIIFNVLEHDTLFVYDDVNENENLWELKTKSEKLKQRKDSLGCTMTVND